MYKPHDLDSLTHRDAIDAVGRDIDTHPVALATSGILTVVRHIALISHLVTRLAADSHFHTGHSHESPGQGDSTSTQLPVETLTAAAGPLAEALSHGTRALGHYGQALAPLAVLSQPPHVTTPHHESEATDTLRRHLRNARRSLAQARTALHRPATTTPNAPRSPGPVAGRRR
ncbi:hypothetical protein ACFRI7_11870 [Streptomyces sp. NPDC056716]|uniref:hypothetical protein n=1 Tax=unclassified Streptomyces TaxID=2593676 RepID=UPI0036C25150